MEISQRTELEELRYQAGQITDESLEITRHMLNMMEESEDAGKQTMENLHVQKEQLNRIEKSMDNINADMTLAERSLSRLKRCCNICAIPWNKAKNQYQADEDCKSETERKFQVIVDQPQPTYGKIKQIDINSANCEVSYITRITNDAREDEMESNLCQVNSILGNLKDMALDMNSELSLQNDQIGKINAKGDANTNRLNQVNVTANNLLNS